MISSERTLLLVSNNINNNGLSLVFAIICVVDVFGVFPIVALPKTIIDCGFYGILVVIVVCSIQMYTAVLLGRCWIMAENAYPAIRKKYRYPYSALAEVTYGKRLSKFVTFLLDLTIFGAGIPNLILASQNLQLLGLRISDNGFNISFCYWIIVLGTILCPILWLGSPKDMKLVCSISATIVVGVFLLIFGCIILSSPSDTDEVNPQNQQNNQPLWHKMFIAYGIISFQFDIHPTILTIQMDMNDKRKLSKAVCGGFAVTLGMFAAITSVAAFKYEEIIKPSILETLPTSLALHFASILVSVQLCLTSAISNSALYQHMEDCLSISREFNPKRCVLRTILTVLAVVIAESVPRFDLVMSLIGGSLTGPLVFILPPLFYIKMKSLQKKHEQQLALDSFTNIVYSKEDTTNNLSKYREHKFQEDLHGMNTSRLQFLWNQYVELCCCILIIFVSCVATIVTTYTNGATAVMYATFTQPCIYNLTTTLLYL